MPSELGNIMKRIEYTYNKNIYDTAMVHGFSTKGYRLAAVIFQKYG